MRKTFIDEVLTVNKILNSHFVTQKQINDDKQDGDLNLLSWFNLAKECYESINLYPNLTSLSIKEKNVYEELEKIILLKLKELLAQEHI